MTCRGRMLDVRRYYVKVAERRQGLTMSAYSTHFLRYRLVRYDVLGEGTNIKRRGKMSMARQCFIEGFSKFSFCRIRLL